MPNGVVFKPPPKTAMTELTPTLFLKSVCLFTRRLFGGLITL